MIATDIRVLATPKFLTTADLVEVAVQRGACIADMIEVALPGAAPEIRERLRVTIDGNVIRPEVWHRVRPKAGTSVVIRPVPGDSEFLRSALTIVVTVAAIAAGQFAAPLLVPSLIVGSGGVQIAAAAITATTLFLGQSLINAIVPPRSDSAAKPTYAIQGLRNQATPDGVLPDVLGKHRMAPPYAMLPWTEAIGDERYVTAAFIFGYGPLKLTNFRIGETPIERFKDVIIEFREGYETDARLTLCPSQVIEKPLTVELKSAAAPTGGPNIRTTPVDVTGCSIDITFPSGIVLIDEDGDNRNNSVSIQVRYRKAGTTTWSAAIPIVASGKEAKQMARTYPITFPERGRYEVELTRLSPDWEDTTQKKKRRMGRTVWTALRSYRPEYPINFPFPVAVAAVKIRATGQLQGVLDEFNCDASRICPDWDAASGTWITRETQNPASLFRHVLMGRGNAYPMTAAEIGALTEWHAFCAAKGLKYNRVHNFEASLSDVLGDIAAAGRAVPYDNGEVWDVVIDRAIDIVTAHLTPRNSWGFEGERRFSVPPDGFRASFLDETNDFQQAERIVPWPGFTGEPINVQKLDLPGITDPAQVYRELYRRMLEIEKRPDTYWAFQDFESFGLGLGDRVQAAFVTLARETSQGRVLVANGGVVTLDEPVTMEAGQSYAIRFRRDDWSTLLRPVQTVPGTTSVVRLTGVGDAPEAGNLFLFGLASKESIACTVKGIEANEKFQARIALVDHAAEIEATLDALVVPPWSGRAGGPAQDVAGAPLVPIVVSVSSGQAVADSATPEIPNPVIVALRANPLDILTITTFEVRHRFTATTTWSGPVSAPVAAGVVILPGYSKGAQIEFQAREVSNRGVAGPWTASAFHTVAASDPSAPANLKVTTERRVVSGATTADILRLTCDPPTDTTLILAGRYRAVGATDWLSMVRDGESLYRLVSPDIAFGQAYEAEGAITTPSGAQRSDWFDATPAVISAPIYTADFQAAAYVGGGAPTITRASSGYAANSGGAYALFAADTLRRTNVGLTVEEAITNVIRNNSMQGAVAGTPGTLPSTWTIFNEGNGVTRQIVGTGTENGIDYIDLRYFGTVTAGTIIAIDVEPGYPAAVGQLWTYSNFVKLVGGSLANVTIARHIRETGGGSNGITETPFVPTSGSLGSQRGSISRTLTVAGSTAVIGRLYIFTTTGTTIDLTLRIGWPQTERRDNLGVVAARASSPIRTTGSAVTRAADAVTLPLTGVARAVLTYSDGTTQEFAGISPASAWTIPAASLTRSVVTKLAAYAS